MNAARVNILKRNTTTSSDISSFIPLNETQAIPYPSPNTMADGIDLDHLDRHQHVNGRAMLIVFFSIFFVVFLVVLFLLYAKCVLGRRARRRALIHHLSTPASAAQTHTHELPKGGLDPSVIATLPTFVYKKTDARNDSGAECAVCLSALEEEEMARILPNCKHVFHACCIDTWLNSHSTCPICRTGAEPQAEQAREPAVFAASAPPLDRSLSMGLEGTSDAVGQSSKEGGGSVSRLSSFRRILSWERSERRMQSGGEDLERQ